MLSSFLEVLRRATVGLTAQECGHALRLMLHQWEHGLLPDKDELERVSPGVGRVWGRIEHLFQTRPHDGFRVNPELAAMREEHLRRKEAHHLRAVAGATARWSRHHGSNRSSIHASSMDASSITGEQSRTSEADASSMNASSMHNPNTNRGVYSGICDSTHNLGGGGECGVVADASSMNAAPSPSLPPYSPPSYSPPYTPPALSSSSSPPSYRGRRVGSQAGLFEGLVLTPRQRNAIKHIIERVPSDRRMECIEAVLRIPDSQLSERFRRMRTEAERMNAYGPALAYLLTGQRGSDARL